MAGWKVERVLVCFLSAVLLCLGGPAVWAQGANKTGKRERKPPEAVNPSFRGETLTPPEPGVDPGRLLEEAKEKLGGQKAYEALRDLFADFKHKYYMKNQLRYIDRARVYVRIRPGERLKVRVDYDMVDRKNQDKKIDYREVLGDDGPFKFVKGRIIRTPFDIREAGEHLYRYLLGMLVPFCLDPAEAKPEYLGDVTWEETTSEGTRSVTCRKLKVRFPRDQAFLEGNVLALYVDKGSGILRRMACESYHPGDHIRRLYVTDFLARETVAGVSLPTKLVISVFWDQKPYSLRKVYFTGYRSGKGFEGIGFEMATQDLSGEPVEEKAGREKGTGEE